MIPIGLELDNEERALAWALDFPGCFAYGKDGPEAVIALPRAVIDYAAWVNAHAGEELLPLGDFDLRVVDTWQVYTVDDGYNISEGGYAVNAWFRSDWKPLSSAEIAHGLRLLAWSRFDLLQVLSVATPEQLDWTAAGERWSIRGILKHVANAEWWYMDRLSLAEGSRTDLPKDALERLARVRHRLAHTLPTLAERDLVIGKEGEFWSPRKLLRRILWHERDHHLHIQKLLSQGMD